MNLKKLREPFPENEIEWRIQQFGVYNQKPFALILPYVTARGVQDRLDSVVGPEFWKVSFNHLSNGVICTLSIKVGDDWVAKQDGSPETAIEKFKGGMSKAMVRAAVQWGVGRYLYSMPKAYAIWCEKRDLDAHYHKDKNSGNVYYWKPPKITPEFLPPPTTKFKEIAERAIKNGATTEEKPPVWENEGEMK